jgi:hypothetical protein
MKPLVYVLLILWLAAAAGVIAQQSLTPSYNSFTGGQVTPHLEGRTDFPKYMESQRITQNFLPLTEGPIRKRPGTTLGGAWDQIPGEPQTMTYFSQNGSILGVPLVGSTLQRLSGEAVDLSGGLVGFTMVGHPFAAGQTIKFYGVSVNYSGTFTLHANTSVNQLVFTSSFYAEDFDLISPGATAFRFNSLPSGLGRSTQDSNGNIYYGFTSVNYAPKSPAPAAWSDASVSYVIGDYVTFAGAHYKCVVNHTSNASKACAGGGQPNLNYINALCPNGEWLRLASWIAKVDVAGAVDYDFFDTENQTIGANGGELCSLDVQGDYMYVTSTNRRVHKFSMATGATEWDTGVVSGVANYDADTDSNGNTFTTNIGPGTTLVGFSAGHVNQVDIDGNLTEVSIHGTNAIWIDETIAYEGQTGILLSGQRADSEPTLATCKNIWIRALNNLSTGTEIALGPVTGSGPYTSAQVEFNNIKTYNGFIYVLLEGVADGTIYKLDTSLTPLDTLVVADASGFYFDLDDNLVVLRQDSGGSYDECLLMYDPSDFSPKSSVTFPTGTEFLKLWADQSQFGGEVHLYPASAAPTSQPAAEQPDAARLIPFVFSTDDSYILAFDAESLGFLRTNSGVSGRIQE